MLTIVSPPLRPPVEPISPTRRPLSAASAPQPPVRVADELHLNPRIERYFLRFKQDPAYRPVILAVEEAILHRDNLEALHRTAREAAREQLRLQLGREPKRNEVLERAYVSAAAAIIARPYSLPGIADLKHYFVSAALSSRAYRKLSRLPLPDPLREATAVRMAVSLGVFKELLDIPSSGFDRNDLQADVQGARSPFKSDFRNY